MLYLLVALALAPQQSASQIADAGRTLRVPVAPPTIMIVRDGELEPAWEEPTVPARNRLFLREPKDREIFGASPPESVRASLEAFASSLPPDYLQILMRRYGYVPMRGGSVTASNRDNLRTYDLARFLFGAWVDHAPNTRLGREFSCLSPGEFIIAPFLALVADRHYGRYREEPDHQGNQYRRDPRLTGTAIGYSMSTSANLALSLCEERARMHGERLPRE